MLPLADRRILITRAPHQASALADELLRLGAVPVLVPTIEIAPPTSFSALDTALGNVLAFDLVVFTSTNAVAAFHQRIQHLSVAAKPNRIAVVGPSTAKAVERIGMIANLMPPTYTAESLAGMLAPDAHGQHMLLVRAADAPDFLVNALVAAGAKVAVAPAYRNRIPPESIAALTHLFTAAENYPDAITFTSASTALNLVALLRAANLILPEPIVRASIGPVTSQALRELSFPPHVEAALPTIPALADSLAAHFAR